MHLSSTKISDLQKKKGERTFTLQKKKKIIIIKGGGEGGMSASFICNKDCKGCNKTWQQNFLH